MTQPLTVIAPLVMLILALSMVIALVRLLWGPSLPDRVVALDVIGLGVMALVASYSIHSHEPLLLRPVAVLALISFLATVAFAYYVERKGVE